MSKQVVSMKDVEKQMSVYSNTAKARINQPAGNTIGTRNGKFTYKQEVIGNELSVIVLDFIHMNTFYTGTFDADNPAAPVCFAFSDDGLDMAPFDVSPERQNDICDGCTQNAWGSGRGRAKACKNGYRLAVMEADSDPEDADVAFLAMAPTSMVNFDKYVVALDARFSRPPFGVVTLFGFEEDAEWPVITCAIDEIIEDAGKIAGIIARLKNVREQLMEPFDVTGYEQPGRNKKKAAKKKALKKKGNKKTARKKKGSKFS